MEINAQQMEALLHLQEQQPQAPKKHETAAQGFEKILNQELGGVDAADASNAGVSGAGVYSRVMLEPADDAQAPRTDAQQWQAALDQVSNTLDMWDSYARTLGGSRTDTALRDAYRLLEGIDAQVSQWRENGLRGANASLDGILNELEIMTATEKIKFNRGDYVM